ncbi:hypothetical protein ACLMJJ_09125 [Bifidobacterium longum]|uniref:hypothetical protein n=1 Tax=Bifidobacterium longum TaxID=216816 RepID=UPI00398CECE6
MACESWLRLATSNGVRSSWAALYASSSAPGSFRRKFTALDLDLLMAVIAVCLAPAVHPIAADIILTALAVWAMRNSR